ncbi:MAG: hypothetical protein HFE74_07230 [Firmicutes bacterium]|jgi:hypothetical protein|nr:hypothetical protein [Bacillota bacterium]
MKKKIVSLILSLVLVLSFCSVAFADSGNDDSGIVPYDTHSITFNIDRITANKADVYMDVHFSQTVDQYSVVVYLQKKVNGEWVIDTSNPDRTLYHNGWKKSSFYFYNQYTGLERGVTYRIKCVSKDYIGSTTTTTTVYSNTF